MYSRGSVNSGGAIAAADRVLKTEGEHKGRIKELHARTCVLGDLLAYDGEIESSMRSVYGNEEDRQIMDEFEQFLQGQREKIKALTKKHIDSSRNVDAFMAAVRQVKSDVLHGRHQQAQTDDDDEDTGPNQLPPDYEVALQSQIELQKSQLESSYVDYKDADFMRTIAERLREAQHERAKGGGNDEDDDVELEVTNTESAAEYKCPITGQFMEEPMRNKMCGHVYSKKGITFYLRTKNKCPFPGCRNDNVMMDQLELDSELEIKIMRFQKRMDNEKMRLTQEQDEDAVDVDDMEDDQLGMTIID